MPLHTLRRLRDAEVPAAARLLGRAFSDDPLLVHASPDPEDRRLRAAAHFTPVLRQAQQCGEVWTTDELAGVACWRLPGRHDPTGEELSHSGLDRMAEAIGADATARMDHVFEFLHDRRHALDVPVDHWYLALIGVDAQAKGQGVGSALVTSKLEARAGSPVFLETMAARNVPFYTHLGFRCVDTGIEPSSGLDYWMFLFE